MVKANISSSSILVVNDYGAFYPEIGLLYLFKAFGLKGKRDTKNENNIRRELSFSILVYAFRAYRDFIGRAWNNVDFIEPVSCQAHECY